jgi:predicted ester cyclase
MAVDYADLARRFYKEVFDNGNVDAVDDFCASDYLDHAIKPEMGMTQDREGLKAYCKMYLDAFSGMRVDVEDVVTEGNKAAVRATFHGTHTGPFLGIQPTGKQIKYESVDIVRFKGDKAVEHWGWGDDAGLLMTLGALPPLG